MIEIAQPNESPMGTAKQGHGTRTLRSPQGQAKPKISDPT